jgi:hypothetical protein
MIANAYKSRTTKDRLDTNIPLSVQPWGLDGEKRRYWLIEGQNDTHFRVYRETDPHKTKKVKWFSVAGDIDELRVVATKLEEEDGRKEAKALGERMIHAIPRFEASEVVRKPSRTLWPSANLNIEAQASRISPQSQCDLYSPRSWLLALRRSHPWQTSPLHIFRRRRFRLGQRRCSSIHANLGKRDSRRALWSYCHCKWPAGQVSRNRPIWRDSS